jgi:hypothetical protein
MRSVLAFVAVLSIFAVQAQADSIVSSDLVPSTSTTFDAATLYSSAEDWVAEQKILVAPVDETATPIKVEPAPEPTGVVLAILAVIAFGLFAYDERRRKRPMPILQECWYSR